MITENESKAIVLVRAVAMLCIVICHVFQAYDSPLANLFNVGVPIFFCISGYLYGNKQIENWGKWSVGRIKKVYIPYLLLLIIIAPICALVSRGSVSVGGVFVHLVDFQGFTHSFGGPYISAISNTWFVTAIALCYLITPLLQNVRRNATFLIIVLTVLVIVGYFLVEVDTWMFVASWLYLYTISYLFANLGTKQKSIACYALFGLTLVAIVIITINKSIEYPYGRIIKDLAGLLSVTIILRILVSFKKMRIGRAIEILSKYSYEIYLVNYILLLGPLSFAHSTKYTSINIILCLLAIVIFTYILAIASKKVVKFIDKKR